LDIEKILNLLIAFARSSFHLSPLPPAGGRVKVREEEKTSGKIEKSLGDAFRRIGQ
jgi:hypothetical protein